MNANGCTVKTNTFVNGNFDKEFKNAVRPTPYTIQSLFENALQTGGF